MNDSKNSPQAFLRGVTSRLSFNERTGVPNGPLQQRANWMHANGSLPRSKSVGPAPIGATIHQSTLPRSKSAGPVNLKPDVEDTSSLIAPPSPAPSAAKRPQSIIGLRRPATIRPVDTRRPRSVEIPGPFPFYQKPEGVHPGGYHPRSFHPRNSGSRSAATTPTGQQPIPRRPLNIITSSAIVASLAPTHRRQVNTLQFPVSTTTPTPPTTNTWSPGAAANLSPSDSGYRSLPSSTSDYQIIKSPAAPPIVAKSNSNTTSVTNSPRRKSLPASVQSTPLQPTPTTPRVTVNSLPPRPASCHSGLFLGCTHPLRPGTPGHPPATISNATAAALQQLLLQTPKNGFKSIDEKVNLFLDILDSQERFEQVQ